MPKRALTETELFDKKVKKKVGDFLSVVERFLASKNGGVVAEEWMCGLEMLRAYYAQFIRLSMEIEALPSLIVTTRYGAAPSPLLKARDTTAVRLESLLKSMGLTLKSALSMDIAEPVKEESALERFVRTKAEGRGE